MTELLTRTLSGVVYVGILVGSALLGPLVFSVVTGIILYLAVKELLALTGPMSRDWHTDLTGVAAMLLFAGLALLWFRVDSINAVIVLLAGGAAFVFLLIQARKHYIRTTATQIYLTITYLLLPLLMLLALTNPERDGRPTSSIVLGLFVMIWTFDTFAYLSGKKFGKHKLAPSISPKKTWEGFAGGLIASLMAAAAWHSYHHQFELMQWILLAVVASVAGTFGDLFESQLKRKAGVKDSGSLIPGHGGILDRIDSILFAAPLALFIILLFF